MGKSIGKWVVQLTEAQREQLQKQARAQSKSALAAKRARILLLCDQSHSDGGKTDDEIAEQIGMTRRQVQRIRRGGTGEREGMGARAHADGLPASRSHPPRGQS